MPFWGSGNDPKDDNSSIISFASSGLSRLGFRVRKYEAQDPGDPPIPEWGKPIDPDKLQVRHKKSRKRCEHLVATSKSMAAEAVAEATTIPVAPEKEKIFVTSEASKRIDRIATEKALNEMKESNVAEIKEGLKMRNSVIKTMNNNYSGHRIGVVEDFKSLEAARASYEHSPLGQPQDF
jgi:ribosomal protein L14E/L6E/L27E